MRLLSKARRTAVCFALLLALASFLLPLPAQAQGGFALSGSFYRQEFEIPQGSSVSTPSVYVVVFNTGDEVIQVRMTSQAPLGVNLSFSEDDFALEAGGQKKVLIGVEVTTDAAPGEYELSITAEPYRKEGAGGIQIMGAAGQSADLTVLGAGGRVIARMVSPDGSPVPGVVRLFKLASGQSYEVAHSDTGTVEATVAPGSYRAVAYVAGAKLAEEHFEVAADEEKSVTLTVKTVYFEGFGLVPNYRKGTEELAFAQVVYTVNNLYQPVAKAEVLLQVTYNGELLDEASLATLSPLEMGRVGLNYNYIPAEDWKNGSYGFKLELRLEGKPYATTQEEELSVAGTEEASAGINMVLIGAIAAGVIAVGGVIFSLTRRGG